MSKRFVEGVRSGKRFFQGLPRRSKPVTGLPYGVEWLRSGKRFFQGLPRRSNPVTGLP